jgi:hypothetical protein
MRVGDRVLDNGLNALDLECNAIYACSQEPVTYVDAITNYALGNKQFVAGAAFGAPSNATGGRQSASVAFTGGPMTASGTVAFWAAVDTVNLRLLAAGPVANPLALNSSQTFGLNSFSVALIGTTVPPGTAILVPSSISDSVPVTGQPVLAIAGVGGPIIPTNRTTVWQPGVTYNVVPTAGQAGNTVPSNYAQAGYGIPNRTTIYTTLTPNGTDDTTQIQTAINNCPPNQVVQLSAGVFRVTGNGLWIHTPNMTLRGAGAGQGKSTGVNGVCEDGRGSGVFPTADATATMIVKADRATNYNYEVISVSPPGVNDGWASKILLTANAVQGAYSCNVATTAGLSVGMIVLVDEKTGPVTGPGNPGIGLDPDIVYGPQVAIANNPGAYYWFCAANNGPTAEFARHITQLMEIATISGNTVTFTTPFHHGLSTANDAKIFIHQHDLLRGVGIENLMVFGGYNGDYHGNVPFVNCAYCWMKNCESFYSNGTGIGFYFCFRCELRDSFCHETPSPIYGGNGYLTGLNTATSDCLFENNIMWFGNKVIVMRGTGGGNVVAYNYMDDAFGYTYCNSPEAGVNAGHYTCPHMELLEGNWSQNYKGDSFWGNSFCITVFRNYLTAHRGARPPLNTYVYTGQSPNVSYGDYTSRVAVDNQAYGYNTNFVGNVLGMNGQVLYTEPTNPGASLTGWAIEQITNAQWSSGVNNKNALMWNIGQYQASVGDPAINGWSFIDGSYTTQLRQGNWDWVTATQKWLGLGGTYTNPVGSPQSIPASMYLTSKPAFFGSNPWPWVDPSTGNPTALPAKVRMDANTPNVIA